MSDAIRENAKEVIELLESFLFTAYNGEHAGY
jgi:hypothetical protein